jgi:hypothetical protein
MKLFYITVCIMIVCLVSCKKDDIPGAPDDFSVSPNNDNVTAGQAVQFNLSGTADIIIFYSGEMGKKFAFKDRLKEAGVNIMTFQSAMTQGVLPGLDSMQLLISENLGGYDAENISKATWTDITSRNTKWPTALSATFTTSSSIDISDFNQADKINIAFRFAGKKNSAAAQRKWQIQSLTLSNVLSDGTNTTLFSNFDNAGWVQCNVKNNLNAWNVGEWNVNASNSINNKSGIPIRTAYPITFDPGTAVDTEDNEDWLITSAIDLKTTKPDAGTVIKNAVNTQINSYNYIFKTPGTYTVTFYAVNAGADGSNGVAKELQVTVNP